MGEYARDDILRRYGVDIGDDDLLPRSFWPHECPVCHKRFRKTSSIATHMRDKHPYWYARRVKQEEQKDE